MSRSFSKKQKLFNKKLKEIQKAHKPGKHEARKPYKWKREWGPFIKYDADWDGDYLLDLIIFKLEKMYLELDIFSNEIREDLDPKLKVLKETIDLGKKIQTFDYETESTAFSNEHMIHYVLIYKHTKTSTQKVGKKFSLQYYKDEELLYKMPRPKTTLEEEVKTGDWMGSKTAMKWAVDNGYDPKDIHLAYGAEWDDQKNHDVWIKILQKEGKDLQKDRDMFFKNISRNYREWWW